MKIPRSILDINKHPIPIFHLSGSQDVDGTGASAQSTAIDGILVRIIAISANIRVAIGYNPTAIATDILILQNTELWLPIIKGSKIAVLGGTANISIAGDNYND